MGESKPDLENAYLQNFTDLMSVLDELGSAMNSQLGMNLVDDKRYLLLAEDAEIKLGSIDKKLAHCRFYLFNDLLIIARYKSKKGKRKTLTGGTGDKIVFGDLIGRKNSQHSFGSNSDDGDESASKTTKTGKKIPTLKLKVWLDLNHVKVFKLQEKGEFGMRIMYTRREEIHDEEDGSIEYVTKVEQSELWFEDESKQLKFVEGIHDAIDLVIESNMSYNQEEVSDSEDESEAPSETSSGDSKRKGKKRSYVKSKDTMREIARRRNKGTLSLKNTEGDLTLNEIAKRYQVDLKPVTGQKEEAAEFSVVFNPGPMGFAVSSLAGEETGVFVGKINDGGMADLGGVTLMDRVIKVADVKIDNTMSWQTVKELIIQKRKTADKSGNQIPLKVTFSRQKTVDENVAREKEKIQEEEKREARRRARKKRGGKRLWATKRDKQRSFGNRMTTLKDLENKYKNAGKNEKRQEAMEEIFDKVIALIKDPDTTSVDPKHEKEAVYLLKEIHDTEKDYVHKLYSIIDNYKRRMEKSRIQVRCKDLKLGNTKFCEHGKFAFTCSKTSTTIRPVASKEEIKKIFANIEVITKVNEQLLHALQEALEKLNEKNAVEIGLEDIIACYAPAFVKTMPFFKMYSVYASQYSSALEYFAECKDRKEFRDFLAKLESKKNVKSLSNLLIEPVSRLCKYPLLFENLNKASHAYATALAKNTLATGKGNMDKLEKMLDDLDLIYDTVSEVAESVNIKVGEHHDLDKLSEIYAELGGSKGIKNFMLPSRKFTEKYDCLIVDKSKNKAKPKPAYFYLFNDLAIVAVDKSGTMKKLTQKKASERRNGSQTTSTSDRGSVGTKTSSKRKSGGKDTLRKAKVKVMQRWDILNLKPKKLNEKTKDGFVGFTLHVTSRETVDHDKNKRSKETGTEIKTYINRFDIFLYSPQEKDKLMKLITDNIQEQKDAKEQRKNMQRKYGVAGERRKYKTGGSGGRGAGASSSKHRQATLAQKLEERKAAKAAAA